MQVNCDNIVAEIEPETLMIATRLTSAVTAIAIGAASLTAASLIVAPPAQAAIGCCMIRTDRSSEWLQGKQKFKDCKRLNAEKDGDQDKLLKKTGLVWWNLRC